jgi:hypothetical protein
MTWVLLGAAAVAGVVFWWKRVRGASRQRRLMLLCDRAGLDFAPLDLQGASVWLPFPMFGRERSGAENVVWQRERGFEIRVFDFWYEDPATQDRPAPARKRLTCGVVPLAASAPRLRVSPRDLAAEVREAIGLREIELELERFNRRFVVETQDQRFAIAFLEQRMMEGLLALPDGVTAETHDHVLLLSASELPAEQVLLLYDTAVAIHRRIPRSLASLYPPRPARGPHEGRWLQGHWSAEPTEDPV